jgi:hypothetical protein
VQCFVFEMSLQMHVPFLLLAVVVVTKKTGWESDEDYELDAFLRAHKQRHISD